MSEASLSTWGRIQAYRHHHERVEEVLFFFGGFCFDLLLLHSIDSVPMLIHQGTYVVLLAVLIGVDHHYVVKGTEPTGFFSRVLKYRIWVIHFLFGTLLNAFVVFYFRAASLTSLGFIIFMPVLALVLIANELPHFRKLGPVMRMALWSFTFSSYLAYLFPVLLGAVSRALFITSVALASLALYALWKITTRFTQDPQWTFNRAVVPGVAVQGGLLVLYLLGVVPPIPLSLKWIGVYHDVVKEEHGAKLVYTRPEWKPWEHGAQTFHAQPGDKVWVWSRIFAPKKFHDGLRVRWLFDDPKLGWTGTDAIPLTIRYSGEHGWYGGTYKEHWEPGDWKVRIETDDERVVGSISLKIIKDEESDAGRTFVEERR